MRTSEKTDFRKLRITLVGSIYPGQRPECPSLSPHFLLVDRQLGVPRLVSYLAPHVRLDSRREVIVNIRRHHS